MRNDPLAPVKERHHPYQVWAAGLLVVGGLPTLLGGPRPGSIDEYLPSLLVYMWAGVIVACGTLIVAAAVVQSELTSLYWERAAHRPLAVMCAVYSGCAIALAGLRGAFAAGIVLGVALAAWFRSRQVARKIRALRGTLNEKGRSR